MNKGYKSINYLPFVLLLTGIGLKAQVELLSPNVLSNASGEGKSARIWLQWTLGETAIRSGASEAQLFTEGFHQPGMILSPKLVIQGSIKIDIAPNPTYSTIQVNIHTDLEDDMFIYLNDVKGSQMLYQRLPSKTNQTMLNVQGLATGIYFLQIRNASGSLFKSFKVIKL